MARWMWTWRTGDPMSRFRTAVDRLFENYGEGELPWRALWEADAYPRMAAADVGDRYVLEAEVPGVRMEDLEITCIDRTLTIRGERPEPEDARDSYERRERPAGTFLRSVELPEELDAAKTEAVLEEGILRITLPKAERAGPRRIEIRSPARGAGTSTATKAEVPVATQQDPKKEEK